MIRGSSLVVLVLLKRENVLVEVLLQLLVGKVDVELLKAIHFKILKAKDVQDSYEGKFSLSSSNACIDLLQNPLKETVIQSHGS